MTSRLPGRAPLRLAGERRESLLEPRAADARRRVQQFGQAVDAEPQRRLRRFGRVHQHLRLPQAVGRRVQDLERGERGGVPVRDRLGLRAPPLGPPFAFEPEPVQQLERARSGSSTTPRTPGRPARSA